MIRSFSILSMLFGTFWAQVLLVAGLSLLFAPVANDTRLLLGLALVGAGAFVAMGLVIDRLVPEAGAIVVLPLKVVAAGLFVVGGALSVYGIVTGQPFSLPGVI